MPLGSVIAALAVLCAGLSPAWAADTDSDGMSDAYELFFGLNPTNPADAALNYDTDDLNNLAESILCTDPWVADTDRDGFPDHADSNAVSRAYTPWGDPDFIASNACEYTAPAWFVGAWREEGQWDTGLPAWHVPAAWSGAAARVFLEVDRSVVTGAVRMDLELLDQTNAAFYVGLWDTNAAVVVSNLYGNLMTGSGGDVWVTANVPLATNAAAARIGLWREQGEITLYQTLLYFDADGDQLDADQEAQLGTSDADWDSDDDGLDDGAGSRTRDRPAR